MVIKSYFLQLTRQKSTTNLRNWTNSYPTMINGISYRAGLTGYQPSKKSFIIWTARNMYLLYMKCVSNKFLVAKSRRFSALTGLYFLDILSHYGSIYCIKCSECDVKSEGSPCWHITLVWTDARLPVGFQVIFDGSLSEVFDSNIMSKVKKSWRWNNDICIWAR